MKTSLNVLIPTDFTANAENAIKYGVEFIDKFNCNLFLQHVFEPYQIATELPMVEAMVNENNERTLKAKIKLESITNDIQKKFPSQFINQIISEGDPVEKIIETARKSNIDLIIVGNTTKSPLNRFILGNITNKIIEKSPCPVLIIPHQISFKEIKNMAYAAMLTETELWKINQLTVLASAFGSSLHIIHINEKGTEKDHEDFKEFKSNAKKEISHARLIFETMEAENIVYGIENYIHTHQIDLLGMSTKSRIGLQKLFNTSISEKVASKISIPLLIFHYNQED